MRTLLTATMGYDPPGIRGCSEAIKLLCNQLGESSALYSALTSDWMRALVHEPLPNAMAKAEEILRLAQMGQNLEMTVGAYRCLADTAFFKGSFRQALSLAQRGIKVAHDAGVAHLAGEVSAPIVTCISFEALSLWQLGQPDKALERIEEAVERARSIADAHSLAVALHFAGYVSHFCGLPERAERVACELLDISSSNNFRFWRAGAHVQLGWARTIMNRSEKALHLIDLGIQEWRATGAELIVPYWMALSVEARIVIGRLSECPLILQDACQSASQRGELWWKADLLRLQAKCFADLGRTSEAENLLRQAMDLAHLQGSVSLHLRAANAAATSQDGAERSRQDVAHPLPNRSETPS